MRINEVLYIYNIIGIHTNGIIELALQVALVCRKYMSLSPLSPPPPTPHPFTKIHLSIPSQPRVRLTPLSRFNSLSYQNGTLRENFKCIRVIKVNARDVDGIYLNTLSLAFLRQTI